MCLILRSLFSCSLKIWKADIKILIDNIVIYKEFSKVKNMPVNQQ
ncbi:hypothetical protein GCM10008027_45900 [Pseudoalteromonas gelatinilytica]|uniref:Uncharacterized protein n=1 Tax=Pseudoalteromonas gelatinilytica TaxID=1703256 RepID=A0ABQ1UED1_9GAMM|nr:hypothetical protein GCM10008027_45900 [Pseudoalteromonas profundi]